MDEEIYECTRCEMEFEEDDVYRDWLCPECDQCLKIIMLESKSEGIVVHRVQASDVQKGDYVHLPHRVHSDYEPHYVFSVTQSGSKVSMNLEKYGKYTTSSDTYLNTRQGKWSK